MCPVCRRDPSLMQEAAFAGDHNELSHCMRVCKGVRKLHAVVLYGVIAANSRIDYADNDSGTERSG